jgi:hypothetical protein
MFFKSVRTCSLWNWCSVPPARLGFKGYVCSFVACRADVLPVRYIFSTRWYCVTVPCGGGVEYLHSSPAISRRWRKANPLPGIYPGYPAPRGYKHGDLALQVGESRIWDSKTWSCVPLESDLRMTALTRTSRNCIRHTHPLVREHFT